MKRITLSEVIGITFLIIFLSFGVYGVFDLASTVASKPTEPFITVSADGSESCVVRRVPAASGKIALTFDDGPHERYTEEILDILAKYDIKATFFVIGTNADTYPELIRKELSAGHEVENHTLSHVYLKKASSGEFSQK